MPSPGSDRSVAGRTGVRTDGGTVDATEDAAIAVFLLSRASSSDVQ